MITLLDIGNTGITYGTSKGRQIQSLKTFLHSDIPKIARICSSGGGKSINHVVIGSVVPSITKTLEKKLKKKQGLQVWIAGRDLPIRISHKYNRIKDLGIDRLVNIYGAKQLGKLPVLILDYGTAITADYVSARGIFEGGMIIPGPELSFQALIDKAALLPKKARLPHRRPAFLGRSTKDCLSAGILEGYGALTDDLIGRFRKRFGARLKVLMTGGFARHLAPYVKAPHQQDPRHSLRSLLILFRDNQKIS